MPTWRGRTRTGSGLFIDIRALTIGIAFRGAMKIIAARIFSVGKNFHQNILAAYCTLASNVFRSLGFWQISNCKIFRHFIFMLVPRERVELSWYCYRPPMADAPRTMVGKERVELSRSCDHRFLRPTRIPVPPLAHHVRGKSTSLPRTEWSLSRRMSGL